MITYSLNNQFEELVKVTLEEKKQNQLKAKISFKIIRTRKKENIQQRELNREIFYQI